MAKLLVEGGDNTISEVKFRATMHLNRQDKSHFKGKTKSMWSSRRPNGERRWLVPQRR
jgi:hypothetical protein